MTSQSVFAVHIYQSRIQHSVSSVHYKSPLYICHCRSIVASTSSLLSARLKTGLRLNPGRSVLWVNHFLRCFSHPGPQDVVAPQPDVRLLGCLCCDVANLLHLRVILNLFMHAEVEDNHENHRQVHLQEDPPKVICRERIHCCIVHRRIRCGRCA